MSSSFITAIRIQVLVATRAAIRDAELSGRSRIAHGGMEYDDFSSYGYRLSCDY